MFENVLHSLPGRMHFLRKHRVSFFPYTHFSLPSLFFVSCLERNILFSGNVIARIYVTFRTCASPISTVIFIFVARPSRIAFVEVASVAVLCCRMHYTGHRQYDAAQCPPSVSNSPEIHSGSETYPMEFFHLQTFWKTPATHPGNSAEWLACCMVLFGRSGCRLLARRRVSPPLGRKY